MVKRKKLKIGWTKCRIIEKVEPPFCGRCQNFGQTRFSCKNSPAKGIRCLKCGEIGHIAKECTGELKCFNCNDPGYRADSMRCPKYAQWIEEANARRLNSRNV